MMALVKGFVFEIRQTRKFKLIKLTLYTFIIIDNTDIFESSPNTCIPNHVEQIIPQEKVWMSNELEWIFQRLISVKCKTQLKEDQSTASVMVWSLGL